jgi:hypothetical protein
MKRAGREEGYTFPNAVWTTLRNGFLDVFATLDFVLHSYFYRGMLWMK